MKLKIDEHYRIRIPQEILSGFNDNHAYFGMFADTSELTIAPAPYMRSLAAEYEKEHGAFRRANRRTKEIFRKVFSKIYSSRIKEQNRVVIPLRVRNSLQVTNDRELDARIVEGRLVIALASQ